MGPAGPIGRARDRARATARAISGHGLIGTIAATTPTNRRKLLNLLPILGRFWPVGGSTARAGVGWCRLPIF
jgi:hypothetical protein